MDSGKQTEITATKGSLPLVEMLDDSELRRLERNERLYFGRAVLTVKWITWTTLILLTIILEAGLVLRVFRAEFPPALSVATPTAKPAAYPVADQPRRFDASLESDVGLRIPGENNSCPQTILSTDLPQKRRSGVHADSRRSRQQ